MGSLKERRAKLEKQLQHFKGRTLHNQYRKKITELDKKIAKQEGLEEKAREARDTYLRSMR